MRVEFVLGKICIDGALHGFFTSTTGLRQGCPLSPYLFYIIMDSLSCLIDNTTSADRFEGFNIENYQLSHLVYADDLLIFGKAEAWNCNCLIEILKTFSRFSCLNLNLHKSSLLFSPHSTISSNISRSLNIHNISTKIYYLGLPISLDRITI